MTVNNINDDIQVVAGDVVTGAAATSQALPSLVSYASGVAVVGDALTAVAVTDYDVTYDNNINVEVEMDPLLALVMAGVEIQAETNKMITALAGMSSKITTAATNATTAGNNWLEEFYDHGVVAEGVEGIGNLTKTYEQDELRDVKFRIADESNPGYDNSSQVMQMYDDISGKWLNCPMNVSQYLLQGVLWAPQSDAELPEGYKLPVDAGADFFADFNEIKIESNADGTVTPEKDEWTAQLRGPAATIKGGGVANADTAEMNTMIQMWQAVQSKVSQVNNSFQTVSAIPGTMLQSLQSSVSTSLSKSSAYLNSIQTRVSMLSSWSGV